MYGAILGDIIGSRFEFDRGGKTKDFELFTNECKFTDDSVMTVAVADGLIRAGKDATIDEIKISVIKSMRYWAKKYPNAGYGGRFYQWLFHTKNPKPYGSYGNGSAMRVSAVGWLYDTLDRTREVACATAEVTHNHPEGIKGADCTAAVIFLARTGLDKKEIREFVEETYQYDLDETLDHMRARHEHVETCMDSMPKALVSFFEGESYEDVVRNAVSLGGDTDTLAAIAGAMAEAYYGITVGTIADSAAFMPKSFDKVINVFNDIVYGAQQDPYMDNIFIKQAAELVNNEYTNENAFMLLEVIARRILDNGTAPAPMIDVNDVYSQIDLNDLTLGDTFSIDQEVRLRFDTVKDEGDNTELMPLFTNSDEIYKGQTTNIIFETPIERILAVAYNDPDLEGIVINPFSEGAFTVKKPGIELVLNAVREHREKNE